MRVLLIGTAGKIGSAIRYRLQLDGHEVHCPTKGECDVRQTLSIQQFLNDYNPSDDFQALVYNAGVNYLSWIEDMEIDQAEEVMNVNAMGFLRVYRQMAEQFQDAPSRIVVIGSDAADTPLRTSAAYNASKAALHSMALCLARERAPMAQVNVVAPGLIGNTFMTDYVFGRTKEIRNWSESTLRDYMISKIPALRPGDAIEVGEVVRWLISDAPNYLTGQVIKVNGGR